MIAVDTNILVYAHREDLPWHESAAKSLITLAHSPAVWAIPWPCVHEFFAKVTHSRLFAQPTAAPVALSFISELARSPTLRFISETDRHWDVLQRLVTSAQIMGPMTHDARIAAICLEHGAAELWTADRDFGRFPQLRVHNPLVAV